MRNKKRHKRNIKVLLLYKRQRHRRIQERRDSNSKKKKANYEIKYIDRR